MENEYINQDTLKLLLVRLANMYNNLNSSGTYTAGDGIDIANNEVSAIIDPSSEKYLTVSGSGLSLSGIDSLISGLQAQITALSDEVYETNADCIELSGIAEGIGNIILYDSSATEYIDVTPDDYTATYAGDSNYTPVAILVVPANLSSTGESIAMALKYGSLNTPDSGTTIEEVMTWGYLESSLENSLEYYNTIHCYTTYSGDSTTDKTAANFARDEQTNSSWGTNQSVAGLYYHNATINFGPDPVSSDWASKNPTFYYDDSATNTFNGKSVTSTILSNATAEDYATIDTLTNSSSSGYYPAAACCYRYSTGISGSSTGAWYLPSSGEAIFMSIFRGNINKGLQAIIDYDSSLAALVKNSGVMWTSTIYSINSVRIIDFSYGILDYSSYSNIHYVRPFINNLI